MKMLSDITIVITAGGRPGYLKDAIIGIKKNLPECKVVVVNDDDTAPFGGVVWKQMPEDTFVTKKRNAGVALSDTKYISVCADDYLFDLNAREVLIKMSEILDKYTLPDVIAGTINNKRYEGRLVWVPGKYIQEIQLDEKEELPYINGRIPLWKVDIAVNCFLARKETLREVPWDENLGPIGGEHADWFLDLKAAGKTVLWTPGLNFYEQPVDRSKEALGYRIRRNRVHLGHEFFLKKRGVKKYVGFGERNE